MGFFSRMQSGQYADWEDFHSDMLLVRDNCHLYNPPGHKVRRDCDEVFAFYHMEYEKTLERWQKVCCFCSNNLVTNVLKSCKLLYSLFPHQLGKWESVFQSGNFEQNTRKVREFEIPYSP